LERRWRIPTLDRVPETVILDAEPEDIDTLSVELTPTLQARVGEVMEMVLRELTRLGARYSKRSP
jgi:hydrogenase maturation protease